MSSIEFSDLDEETWYEGPNLAQAVGNNWGVDSLAWYDCVSVDVKVSYEVNGVEADPLVVPGGFTYEPRAKLVTAPVDGYAEEGGYVTFSVELSDDIDPEDYVWGQSNDGGVESWDIADGVVSEDGLSLTVGPMTKELEGLVFSFVGECIWTDPVAAVIGAAPAGPNPGDDGDPSGGPVDDPVEDDDPTTSKDDPAQEPKLPDTGAANVLPALLGGFVTMLFGVMFLVRARRDRFAEDPAVRPGCR